jgi:hypothetical protein
VTDCRSDVARVIAVASTKPDRTVAAVAETAIKGRATGLRT